MVLPSGTLSQTLNLADLSAFHHGTSNVAHVVNSLIVVVYEHHTR